jgi:CheY-like chemotaxis protein
MPKKSSVLTAAALVLLYTLYSSDSPTHSSSLRNANDAPPRTLADEEEYDLTKRIEYHQPFLKAEVILSGDERKAHKDIKYAAFGSSHTWGARLDHRETDTYVKQLAKPYYDNGINHGIRSSGPNYPANCLYSLIGNEHFDVIILQFYMEIDDGLELLAHRLRQRFPDAIMVFVHHWFPGEIVNEKGQSVDQYREEKGFEWDYMHNPEFHALINNGPHTWTKRVGFENKKNALCKQIAKDVNGYIVKLPVGKQSSGPNGWLNHGHQLLNDDSFHPSVEGHTFIANQVKEIVERVGVTRNPRVEPFAQLDQCYNWLMDGILDTPNVKYSDNFQMIKMPHTQKYTLELTDSSQESWIDITNPSEDNMDVYIGTMTTSPERKYPMVEASLSNGNKYQIDPMPDNTWGGKHVHVTKMTQIGIMQPNESIKISIKVLEESEWPFRFTSIMITPRNENSKEVLHDAGGGPVSLS